MKCRVDIYQACVMVKMDAHILSCSLDLDSKLFTIATCHCRVILDSDLLSFWTPSLVDSVIRKFLGESVSSPLQGINHNLGP